jgi:mannose-6-phosphate isomerase-like protein (cupin superfamily)
MQRRNFLHNAGFVLPLGLFNMAQTAANNPQKIADWQNPLQPFYLPPTTPLEHKNNMDIRVLVRSEQTGGVYSCVECAVAPKIMGPPPHYHKALDEMMFVLEGTASVVVEGKEVQVEAGGWHFRPRGLEHTFWNASEKPLRFIDMYFNQDFELFLEQVFHVYTPEKYPFGSPERDKVMNVLNEKYGLVYPKNAGEQRTAIAQKYGLK